jgi:cell division protein ZapA
MSQLNVTILGQPFMLACREGEEEALRMAVSYLDQRMRTIRDAGKVKGNDRIAVIAALGIAAELLATKAPNGPFSGQTVAEAKQKMDAMHALLDSVLAQD